MAAGAQNVTQRFPLSTLPSLPSELTSGPNTFDADGAWSAEYGIYACGRRLVRSGTVRLQRSLEEAGSLLKVQIRRSQPDGHVQDVSARQHCRPDGLLTPRRWQWAAELMTPAGKTVRGTAIRVSAVVAGKQLTIKDSGTPRTIDLPGPYTLSWSLFAAIPRLPQEPFKASIALDLLDDFDQFKAQQTLSYRTALTTNIGRRKVRLHAYDHLGRGIVPWTYFVADGGPLVLAVSGLKAYGLLQATSGRERGR